LNTAAAVQQIDQCVGAELVSEFKTLIENSVVMVA